MASFNLSDGINRTNNPSIDGIFEYGFWNSALTVFTHFSTYGYTDGTIYSGGAFNNTKIIGWHQPGGNYHVAIAFENLQGNTNITPQPFPNFGVYMHPAGVGVSGVKNIAIRIHIPYDSTFSLSGTIQAASVGCGTNIGYRLLDNMTSSIIPRTNLPKSNTPTNISVSSTLLLTGDVLDLIIDYGDDSNDFCDDTALDLTITVVPLKISTPVIIGTLDCEDSTASYSILLQQTGTLNLYKVGQVAPVASTSIVANGTNGIALFSGLDLSLGGSYYVIATNSGQIDSNPSDTIIITPCCIPVTTAQISGSSTIPVSTNQNYSVVNVNGSAPYTYNWTVTNGTLVSGQGTATIVVNGTSGVINLSVAVGNCGGTESFSVATNVQVITSCQKTVYYNSICYNIQSITGVKKNTIESNRVISYSDNEIKFTTDIGTFDYVFTLLDSLGTIHKVTYKNITCS